MSTQKFILRNKSTGEIVSNFDIRQVTITAGDFVIYRGVLTAPTYYPAAAYELVPVGYVPLDAVREIIMKDTTPDYMGNEDLLAELDRLAKQYGAEDGK